MKPKKTEPIKKPAPKLKPITAERFEREVNAITRLFNRRVLTATQHKAKHDVLVKRVRLAE
jgi:hypothetical protein